MIDKYAYRVTWSEADQEYVGLCAEFSSLSFLHASQDKAFKGIRQLVTEVVEDLLSQGEPVPEPMMIKKFSGKLIVRIPIELHRQLALEAQESHISLNRYISTQLASRHTVLHS